MNKLRLLSTILLTTCILACNMPPRPKTAESAATAKLVKIYNHGTDIVFKLHQDDNSYYINRGSEHGMSIEELKSFLLNETITIKHKSDMYSSVPIDTLFYKDSVIHTLQRW